MRNIVDIPVDQMTEKKNSRALNVSQIKVTTTSGKVFDGDETSQNRMMRAVMSLAPLATVSWVLSDKVPTAVTREELQEALSLAYSAQSALWVTPYV